MKILEFVEEYNKCVDAYKEKKYKDIEIVKYVPFERKLNLANILAHQCTLDNDYNVKINTPARHIFTIKVIIENWTNLESNTASFTQEYDALVQSGLLQLLLAGDDTTECIPSREIEEFRNLVNMCVQDIIDNNHNIYNYINHCLDKINVLSGILTQPLFATLDKKISNLDEKSLRRLYDKIEQIFTNRPTT